MIIVNYSIDFLEKCKIIKEYFFLYNVVYGRSIDVLQFDIWVSDNVFDNVCIKLSLCLLVSMIFFIGYLQLGI